jgi:uncharacterized membrane protein
VTHPGSQGGTANRPGLLIVVLAATALAIALYLALVKLAGGAPACGPFVGCETVNASPYSEVLGIPVALFGAAASALTLGGGLYWWRRHDRRGLLIAYVLGLLSLPALAYLTYLELYVIYAICVWCVTYAVTVIGGWLVAAWQLRRGPAN